MAFALQEPVFAAVTSANLEEAVLDFTFIVMLPDKVLPSAVVAV